MRERPGPSTTTEERRRICVHDLRGTFVTLSLAGGRSKTFISDRTGHRSSQMIARYERNARTFSELELGQLAPLSEALPELSNGPRMGRGEETEIESATFRWVMKESNLRPMD